MQKKRTKIENDAFTGIEQLITRLLPIAIETVKNLDFKIETTKKDEKKRKNRTKKANLR